MSYKIFSIKFILGMKVAVIYLQIAPDTEGDLDELSVI